MESRQAGSNAARSGWINWARASALLAVLVASVLIVSSCSPPTRNFGPPGSSGSGGDAGAQTAAGAENGVGAAGMIDTPTGTGGCTSNAQCVPHNPCHLGALDCTAGMECKDTQALAADGTPCATGKVCSGGACLSCEEGASCSVPDKPCRAAQTSCLSGKPACMEVDNAAEGSPCGDGLACSGGNCVACKEGTACVPANPCDVGALSCAAAPATCSDQKRTLPDGSACGKDKVCQAGACTPCAAGAACVIGNNPCRTGKLACNTGTPVCVEQGNAPNGTTCDTSKVCKDGACMQCAEGGSCVPTNKCHAGTLSCAGGNPVCNDTGDAAPGGTSCGTDKVCSLGTCLDCIEGRACTPDGSSCKVGATSCKTGVAVCQATGNSSDGSSCGSNLVCSGGSCVACAAGASCTPANPCHSGTLSCAGGKPTCTDSGNALSNGASCGQNLVCSAGNCVSCTSGTSCISNGNLCKAATTSCTTGTSTCVVTGDVSGGTSCGSNLVCSGGSCITCANGASCQPSNPCHNGKLSCAGGTPTCNDLGTVISNGTSCGSKLVCSNGSCLSCDNGAACTPAACKTGTVACSTGTTVCNATGNVTNGPNSACSSNQVCYQGACKAPSCSGALSCGQPDGAGGFCTDTKGGTCAGDHQCVGSACKCRGPTVTCSDSSQTCGVWSFDSSTEGWARDPNRSFGNTVELTSSPMQRVAGGGNSLAVTYFGGEYFDFGVQLCNSGTTNDLSQIASISAWVLIVPDANQSVLGPGDASLDANFYYPSDYEDSTINYMGTGQWTQLSWMVPHDHNNYYKFELELRVNTVPWSGKFYFDDFTLVHN